jgi:hypothetical protein
LGELVIDTTNKIVVVQDGATAGGFSQVGTTAVQTLTNKTLTSPILTTPNIGVATGTSVSVTGNITGSYIFGNGSQLSGIDATQIVSGTSNVKVTTSGGNVAVSVGGTSNVVVWASTGTYTTGLSSATGNVTGGNLTTGGQVSATATITGGNLATGGTASAGGNITGGNILTGGLISSTGTITSAANVIGGNLTTAGTITNGNIIITGANIVSSGPTLYIDPNGAGGTDGNVIITGNLTVQGTTTTINSNTVTTNDLFINVANNASTSSAANGGGLGVGPVGAEYASLTFNNSATAWNMSVPLSVTGTITGSNLSAGTGTITGGNIVNSNANGVGNIGSSTTYFNTVFAKATSAQYADLAEIYVADNVYTPGTVVEFGGNNEITVTTTTHSTQVAGIISTQPAYLMNSTQAGEHALEVALVGRVPCLVVGTIRKGDRLVSSDQPGIAQALDMNLYQPGCIVGKALQEYNSTEPGVIEVAVGRS